MFGCTSAPQLPNTWTLKTTPKSQNYFYCESCPQPTKLTNQVYQPLEPDSPIFVAKPVAEPVQIINNPRSQKNENKERRHHKKAKFKSKPVQPKQCIQWSH